MENRWRIKMNEMPEADRANAYAKRRSKVFGLEDPNKAGCGQYTHTQICFALIQHIR